ncbi:MAG: phosphate starvation-inducible protein PsiE, partial [Bacteroidetes bacterium]|nr:phosphate starvation-inducible protein PsiE [Bacteroidota bacterium]
LADKINIYKAEKEKSQLAEIELIKKNEDLILNQKADLETEVKLRTEELHETLSNLKNAQIQLVESEKMSSLGQLTAGLAHEINNPVNFISSTISPLRRDVDDLLEVINKYEKLTLHESQSDEIKEIEQFKKKIDLPYIKTEMPQLFDVINDGAQRTAAIVKGLKSFSRVDELDLKYVDIHDGYK